MITTGMVVYLVFEEEKEWILALTMNKGDNPDLWV